MSLTLTVASAAMFSLCQQLGAPQGPAERVGFAVSSTTGEHRYCELFMPAQGPFRTVIYLSPSGQKIAEKHLYQGTEDTDDGHVVATATPSVVQHDLRDGEVRAVVRSTEGWHLQYREDQNSPWRGSDAPITAQDAIDAGFDTFVRMNWQALSGGETVSMRFVSPPHGRSFDLQARAVPCREGESDKLCLRVELAQILLRWLVDKLYLEYDRATQSLALFEGTVNVRDGEGASQQLRIHYSLPGE